MSGIYALGAGVAGIQKGLADMQKSASEIASADALSGASLESLTQSLVNLNAAQLQVEASAEVVETIEETLGSLFDEFA